MTTPDVRVKLSAEGVQEVLAAFKQVQAAAQKVKPQKGTDFFGGMKGVGSVALGFLGVSTALQAVQTAVYTAAREVVTFEYGLRKLQNVTGANSQQLEQLRQAALKLSTQTQFTPTEALEGLEKLSSRGFNASQSIGALPAVMDLATSAQIDVAKAADVAGSAMAVYGFQAGELTGVLGKLALAEQLSAITGDDLQTALAKSASGAISARQSFDTMLISMGLVRDAGLSIDEAAVSVGRSLKFMSDSGRDDLEKLGIQLADENGKFRDALEIILDVDKALKGLPDPDRVKLIGDIFGDRGDKTFTTITKRLNEGIEGMDGKIRKGAEAVAYLRDNFKNADKVLEQFRNNLNNTVSGQLKLLRNEALVLFVEVGNKSGALTAFLTGLNSQIQDITASLMEVSETADSTSSALQTIGGGIGYAVKIMVAGVLTIVAGLEQIVALAPIVGTTLKSAFKNGFMKMDTGAITKAGDDARKEIAQIYDTLEKRILVLFDKAPPEAAMAAEQAKREQEEAATRRLQLANKEDLALKRQLNALQRQKALLDARLQVLQNELRIKQALSALDEQRNKAEFDLGLISLEEYYRRKRSLLEQDTQAELDAIAKKRQLTQQATELELNGLRAQLALVKQQPITDDKDRTAQQKEILTLQTQINQKQIEQKKELNNLDTEASLKLIERQRTSEALNIEEANAARDLSGEMRQLEEQLAVTQAARHQAALAALDAQIEKTRILLAQEGKGAAEINRTLNAMRQQGQNKIQFGELQTGSREQLAVLDAELQAIQNRIATGQTVEIVGLQQIAALEQQRLVTLRALADKMTQLAEASQDPDMLNAARQFNAQLDDIAVSADLVGQTIAAMQNGFVNALESSLSDFFADGLTEAESFKDAMLGLAKNIAEAFQRVSAQALAETIVRGVSSLLTNTVVGGGQKAIANAAAAGSAQAAPLLGAGSALTSAGGVLAGAATPLFGAAAAIAQSAASLATAGAVASGLKVAGAVAAVAETGGYLYGPSHAAGGIHLEAEGGEYIVRKSVVAQPGILNLLHTLNRGRLPAIAPISRIPKFATGGLVGGSGSASVGSSSLNSSLTVGLAPGLVLEQLKTPEGQRVIVNAMLQNRNAVNQILR